MPTRRGFSLAFALGLGACSTSRTVDVRFAGLPSDLSPQAQARIRLYAIDQYLMDAPASLMAQKFFSAKEGGTKITIPRDLAYLVGKEPRGVNPKDVEYYFMIAVDAQGDGKLCDRQDYTQDYKKLDFKSTSFDQLPRTLTIPLHIVPKGDSCQNFWPREN